MEKIIRIIDSRRKEKFMIDDEYLNGYAKLCGWKATLVYFSLCRHVNRDQYCFPSEELIAKEFSISEKSVQRGIKILVEWNIIEVLKKRRKGGTWRNNAYVLLDKLVWKPKPIHRPDSPTERPEDYQSVDQRTDRENKETNIEGNPFTVY